MKKYVIIVVVACICMICWTTTGCMDKKPAADSTGVDSLSVGEEAVDTMEQIIADSPMPKAADELFDDFIFNFAANRKLQLSRIVFPLPVDKNGKVSPVSRQQWKMERFFMQQDYYTLIFDNRKEMELVKDTAVGHAVIEKIYLNDNTVRQYVFDRIGGQWMMKAVHETPIAKNVNASFLKFYQHFAADSTFQVRSMNSTVEFTAPNPDDDFSTMTGEIFPEQWPSFRPALIPAGFIYNIVYGQQAAESDTKIFVVRGVANGYETEMTFRRVKGQWKLMKFTT